jgi:hypothetical protein
MIAEHTAQDGPTRSVLMTRLSSQPAFASIEAAPAVSRIAQQARTLAMASLRALSSWGSPSYFQLARRAPEHRSGRQMYSGQFMEMYAQSVQADHLADAERNQLRNARVPDVSGERTGLMDMLSRYVGLRACWTAVSQVRVWKGQA